MSLNCQKDLFNLPGNVHYLNCSYKCPFLKSVADAGKAAIERQYHPFTYQAYDFFDPVEEVKKLFAQLIRCENPERIALIPSVSYGIAQVAHNIRLTPGENIVIAADQFPSNIYPWMRVCERDGSTLNPVQRPDSGIWSDAILSAINTDTRVVSIGNVHWTDGTLFDLQKITRAAHDAGALMIVDGTQSVGVMPFDIREIPADAVICAGYKWLLSPYSTGMAYYGAWFDDKFPIEEGWRSRVLSDDFKNLVDYQEQYRPFGYRYSVGETSDFTLLPMVQAALTQIQTWGVNKIQEYLRGLTRPYLQDLRGSGFHVPDEGQRCGHLFGITLPDHLSLDNLQQQLGEANVHVSLRGNKSGYLRMCIMIRTIWRHLSEFLKHG